MKIKHGEYLDENWHLVNMQLNAKIGAFNSTCLFVVHISIFRYRTYENVNERTNECTTCRLTPMSRCRNGVKSIGIEVSILLFKFCIRFGNGFSFLAKQRYRYRHYF